MREGGYPQAMNFLSGAHQEHVQYLKQLSETDFWDYAERSARAQSASMPDGDLEPADAYLVCDLGSSGCVLPLADLRAVVPSPMRFSLLPDTPGWMPGLTAWANTVLAVVDLQTYLLQGVSVSARPSAMLLVAQYEDLFFGLLTSVAATMPELPAVQWQPLAQASVNYHVTCPAAIKGFSLSTKDVVGMEEKEAVFLLDTPILLAHVVKQMRKMALYG